MPIIINTGGKRLPSESIYRSIRAITAVTVFMPCFKDWNSPHTYNLFTLQYLLLGIKLLSLH